MASKPKARQFRKKTTSALDDEESKEPTPANIALKKEDNNSSEMMAIDAPPAPPVQKVKLEASEPATPKPPAPTAKKPATTAKLSFEDSELTPDAQMLLNRRKTRPQSSAALLEPTSNLAITPAYSARSGEYTAEKLAALKKNAISLVNTDLSSVKDEDLMTPQEEAELNRQRFAAASATAGASSSAPINIDEDQGENPAAAEPRDEVDVLIMKKIKAQQKTSAGGDEKQVTEEGPDRVLPTQDQIKRARQKRERARQFPGNGGEDEEGFIPLQGASVGGAGVGSKENKDDASDASDSRLVKEESDESDEDEFEDYRGNKIAFGPQKAATKVFDGNPEDEEDAEVRAWELEQMMKGGGRKISAAIQKSAQQKSQRAQKEAQEKAKSAGVPIGLLADKTSKADQLPSSFPRLLSIDDIQRKLEEATKKLSDRYDQHKKEREAASVSHADSKQSISTLEKSAEGMKAQYEFFRSTRSYLTTLCDCLGQKVPLLDQYESELSLVLKELHDYRRKDRAADLADEISQVRELVLGQPSQTNLSATELAEKETRSQKRVARRQRHETRRHQTHQPEGFSSDEEEPEPVTQLEVELLKRKADQLSKVRSLFDDVDDEFSSVAAIKERFHEWKFRFRHEYTESYTPLSVVQIFSPFVRREMLLWDPLNPQTELTAIQLDAIPLFQELFNYGIDINSASNVDEKDEDLQLCPRLIEKLVVPRVTFLLANCYNPFSAKQTERAVTLFRQFIEEPLPLLKMLSSAVLSVLTESVSSDCVVPNFPPQMKSHQIALALTTRTFYQAIKLLRNVCQWSMLLSVPALQSLCFQTLLPLKLLPFLQQSATPTQIPQLMDQILSSFPESWIATNSASFNSFKQLLVDRIGSAELHSDVRRQYVRLLLHLGDPLLAKHLDEKYKL